MQKMKYVAIALAGLALAPATAPVHAATPRSERFLTDARQLIERGDLRAAAIQLRNSLREDPDNLAARLELGLISLRLGDLPGAEQALDVVRERGYELPRVLPTLGAVLLMQGKVDRILTVFTPGDRPPAVEGEVMRIRGMALLSRNRVDDAEQALRRALELTPNAAVHMGLSRVAAMRRDNAGARREVDQALALDPNNIEGLTARAEFKRDAGDVAGALEDLERAIAQDQRSILARLMRASIAIQQNQLDDANRDIDAVLAISPRYPLALYHRALARLRANDVNAAAEAMQDIQAFANEYIPALYLQGAIFYAQNRLEQAKRSLTRVIQLDQNSVIARRLLGAVHLRLSETQQAYEVLREALERSPNDFGVLGLLGEASLRLGRNDEAAQYFERGAEGNAANTAMSTGLAMANLGAGRSDLAIEQLEQVIARDPTSRQAAQLLIVSFIRNRQFDRAEAVATELKQRTPQSPLPDLYLGVIAGIQRNGPEAERHFRAALALSPNFSPAIFNLTAILVAQNKLAEAETAIRPALDQPTNRERAMIAMSEIEARRNRPDQAIDWLTRAAQASPSAIDPRLRLVLLFIARNEPRRALATVSELLTLGPSNPAVLDVAGRTYMALGDHVNAVAVYRRLVTATSRSAQSIYMLARAEIAAGERITARGTLDDAISADRQFVPALRDRLALERELNGIEAASAIAQRFRRENPTSPIPDILLGDMLATAGQLDSALQAYEAGVPKGPSAEAVAKAFETRLRLNRTDEAIATVRAWLEQNPRSAPVRFLLASHLILLRRYQEALRETTALAELDPSNLIVQNNLTWLYGELRDPRAMDTAARLIAAAPQDPTIAGTVGWIFVNNGRVPEGLELLRRSVGASPNNRNTKFQLASALAQTNEAAAARQLLQEILSDDLQFLYRNDAEALQARLGAR
ncbi:MAG: PEP-CTERM system TPR-repeat protein PrsT [Alphaproteobacteria bacterium]|nr:PEP-CTERM system TPR-repeat protein PrsT [Alphaproteobacteria bacterium]